MMQDLIRKAALFLRKKRLRKFKKNVKFQKDVTIISNNCVAGILYSDFDLQFLSPTINLAFGNKRDFYLFVMNLKAYCSKGELVFKKNEDEHIGFLGSPVASLFCEDLPEIEIHFLHYKDFESAKNAWKRRCNRINYNKVFIAIEAQTDYEKKMIKQYCSFNYPMIIFTNEDFNCSYTMNMKFYKKYGTGINCPILKMISIFGKRGYDEFDFINEIFYREYQNK